VPDIWHYEAKANPSGSHLRTPVPPSPTNADPLICSSEATTVTKTPPASSRCRAPFCYGWPVTEIGIPHGAALLQRDAEDLVAVVGGTTGSDPDTDCTLGTRFQIASVSKQFTAAAVLLLADRGALSVNDPVRNWLDGCPEAWEPVTVHHLLSHASGLVHWHQLPGLDLTRPATTSDLLATFASAPLLSPPGERFSYSSPGYVLLGHIIEQAAGQLYHVFLTSEIFQPLGLTATFSGNPAGEQDLAAGRHDGGGYLVELARCRPPSAIGPNKGHEISGHGAPLGGRTVRDERTAARSDI